MQVGVTGKEQLFLGANAAVTRCLPFFFLRSSSIKLGFSDVSDSISLSQAVQLQHVKTPAAFSLQMNSTVRTCKNEVRPPALAGVVMMYLAQAQAPAKRS